MNVFLFDTHTMIWFFQDDPRLGVLARSLIENPSLRKWISIVSCWEVAIKVALGKMNLGEPTRPYLIRAIAQGHLDLLPITLDHATAVEGLHLTTKTPSTDS